MKLCGSNSPHGTCESVGSRYSLFLRDAGCAYSTLHDTQINTTTQSAFLRKPAYELVIPQRQPFTSTNSPTCRKAHPVLAPPSHISLARVLQRIRRFLAARPETAALLWNPLSICPTGSCGGCCRALPRLEPGSSVSVLGTPATVAALGTSTSDLFCGGEGAHNTQIMMVGLQAPFV